MGIVILNRTGLGLNFLRSGSVVHRLKNLFIDQNKILATTKTMMMMSSSASSNKAEEEEEEVLFETKDDKGVITLNRPKALNSLNLNMIRLIYPKLLEWNSNPNVKMILLKSNSDKAFCAGGDVRAIAESEKGSPLQRDFFREEYILNHLISVVGVPYISLIHGITMGGGLGISVHGPYRVATEKTLIAMPETQIGFFCDVGGSYFLPRLPDKIGHYLGLTGTRLKGLDVVKAGIATHFIPSSHLQYLEDELLRMEDANAAKVGHLLAKHQEQWKAEYQQAFSLKESIGRIKAIFSADSMEKIIELLEKDGTPWAKQVLSDLHRASPSSLKVTFEMLRRGQNKTLPECLKMEYRISQNILQHHDFYAGIRAVLIDKTNQPEWNPKTLQEVGQDFVNSMFEPIPGVKDLEFKFGKLPQ